MRPYHIIKELKFTADTLTLNVDGKIISVDLHSLSFKLLKATQLERNTYNISPSGYGIHWSLLDEDISIDGLLKLTHNKSIMNKKKVVT